MSHQAKICVLQFESEFKRSIMVFVSGTIDNTGMRFMIIFIWFSQQLLFHSLEFHDFEFRFHNMIYTYTLCSIRWHCGCCYCKKDTTQNKSTRISITKLIQQSNVYFVTRCVLIAVTLVWLPSVVCFTQKLLLAMELSKNTEQIEYKHKREENKWNKPSIWICVLLLVYVICNWCVRKNYTQNV